MGRIETRIAEAFGSVDVFIQLCDEGRTNYDLAAEIGVGETTIRRWRAHLGKKPSTKVDDGAPPLGMHDSTSGDARSIDSVSHDIATLEQLIAHAQIDTKEWIPDRVVVNKWDMGYKDATGEAHAKALYQIKASFKRSKDFEVLSAALDAFRSATDEIRPLRPAKKPRRAPDRGLLNMGVLTDCHVGMLAWRHENRQADWDINIAQKVLTETYCELLQRAQERDNAETCLLCFLGDFLHYDSLETVTPANRHLLDADGRPAKMVRVANDIIIDVTKHALATHRKVVVWMLEGNHDPSFTLTNRDWLRRLYQNESRIDISQEISPYEAMPFGRSLLGGTHGHLGRGNRLGEVFSQRYRDMMSGTEKTFVHTGHRHATAVSETNTTIIEQHPTIAAADAYASRNGYDSLRRASVITYDKSEFEVGRLTKTVS